MTLFSDIFSCELMRSFWYPTSVTPWSDYFSRFVSSIRRIVVNDGSGYIKVTNRVIPLFVSLTWHAYICLVVIKTKNFIGSCKNRIQVVYQGKEKESCQGETELTWIKWESSASRKLPNMFILLLLCESLVRLH